MRDYCLKPVGEIHNFCDKLKENSSRSYRWYFVGGIVGAVFVFFIISIFFSGHIGFADRKQHEVSIIDNISPVGNESDPQNSSNPAFEYWYAPPNSFGIQQTKSVNWSWFWKIFKQNSMWQLEAWHPVQEVWVDNWQGQNLNEWLNITRIRNESNASEKITLNVTNNHPTQDLFFRFKFGINLKVKQYVNKSSNYEYTITYPANATENYTVFFNFSDGSGIFRLCFSHSSVARTPKPPPFVTIAILFPFGIGCVEKAFAKSNNSSQLFASIKSVCLKTEE